MPQFLTKEQIEAKKRAKKRKAEQAAKKKLEEELRLERERELGEREGLFKCDTQSHEYEKELLREKAEEGRRKQESEEIHVIEHRMDEDFVRWQKKHTTTLEWEKYIKGTEKIDVCSIADIEEFLSNSAVTDFVLDTSEHMKSIESLIQMFNDAMFMKLLSSSFIICDEKKVEQYGDLVERFRGMLSTYLEALGGEVLFHCDRYTDSETRICEFSRSFDDFQYGIWLSSGTRAGVQTPLGHTVFSHIPVRAELPAQLVVTGIGLRVICARAHYSLQIHQHSSELFPIGDIFYFNFVQIPLMPKTIKQWSVRLLTSQAKTIVATNFNPTRRQTPDVTLKLTFTIPKHVLIRPSALSIAQWDEESRTWKSDHFEQESLTIISETRTVTFSTVRTVPHSLVQKRFYDFPLLWWSVFPCEKNSCLVTFITSTKLEIVVQVVDYSCQLLKPNLPELIHLLRKQMSPKVLFFELAKCGINLDPNGLEQERNTKYPPMEQRVHIHLARMSSHFGFCWSKWNSGASDRRMIFITRKCSSVSDVLTFSDFEKLLLPNKHQSGEAQSESDQESLENSEENISEHQLENEETKSNREKEFQENGENENENANANANEENENEEEANDKEPREKDEKTAETEENEEKEGEEVGILEENDEEKEKTDKLNVKAAFQEKGFATILCHERGYVRVSASETATDYDGTTVEGNTDHEHLYHCMIEIAKQGNLDSFKQTPSTKLIDINERYVQTLNEVLNIVRPMSFSK